MTWRKAMLLLLALLLAAQLLPLLLLNNNNGNDFDVQDDVLTDADIAMETAEPGEFDENLEIPAVCRGLSTPSAASMRRNSVTILLPDQEVRSGLPENGLETLSRVLRNPEIDDVIVVSEAETVRALALVACRASTRHSRNAVPNRTCRSAGNLHSLPADVPSSSRVMDARRDSENEEEEEDKAGATCVALSGTWRENSRGVAEMGLTARIVTEFRGNSPKVDNDDNDNNNDHHYHRQIGLVLGNCPLAGDEASVDTERRAETAVSWLNEAEIESETVDDAAAACRTLVLSGGRV